MHKPVLVIFSLILVSLLFSYFYVTGLKSAKQNLTEVKDEAKELIKFGEITIPYLRERKYESKLNSLEKITGSLDYDSYLTSYNSDGLKINGLLTIPKGNIPEGGFPAIVFVHGYIPPKSYKTTEKYADYIDYLSRNGFVVFKIDLRGHGTSEGEPGGAYYSGDYVIDTLNAYNALQNFDKVNPKKIGLWGHSMGGNVVFRSLVVKKDIPAVVIWAGAGYSYTDLLTYRIGDRSYQTPVASTNASRRRKELMDTYGSFTNSSWFWKLVAPTNYLDGVTTKINVHHAVNDDVVSIEYSRNLMKILDSTTISHELFEYPSGGHNISGQSFTKAMNKTTEFYKENL